MGSHACDVSLQQRAMTWKFGKLLPSLPHREGLRDRKRKSREKNKDNSRKSHIRTAYDDSQEREAAVPRDKEVQDNASRAAYTHCSEQWCPPLFDESPNIVVPAHKVRANARRYGKKNTDNKR